jgi:hypothetical protein
MSVGLSLFSNYYQLFGHVRFGSLAHKPSRAKIHFCPLLARPAAIDARCAVVKLTD